MTAISDLENQLERCVRCGACMAVCPVYLVQRREQGVARGKLALISEHRLGYQDLSRRYVRELTACLLCGSCTQSCPNQVDTAAVVQAARAELTLQHKVPWLNRVVLGKFLPWRRGWSVLMKALRIGRIFWAKRIPKESGLRLRLFRTKSGRRRMVPALARPFFVDRHLEQDWPLRGRRVAVFTGCLGNYMRPQAVDGIVRSLEKRGCATLVPKHQGCCGLVAFGAGENQAARKLAMRNLQVFFAPGRPWPELITSPCASCAYMLKKHLPDLLADDPILSEHARQMASRVVPFSSLWSQLAREEGPVFNRPSRSSPVLTYHDPCHLSRGFGEKDAPRHLLESLTGARFVEMEHPCKCCGHGGSFNISHYDLSLEIAKRKVEWIMATGASILVTECAGCVLQLSDAMSKVRTEFEVITTAEALDRFG